ncbi:putative membrane protein [Chitinivorax tropicus]|uniref:Putative membrane protein n=1 Tax=Chitinivorax tropicus TaxID=714531 RepID=A0A840MLA7_9PROT|nr:DUF350 domain-containing protein [Chitinivorax tropicus]MBB5019944.1 putative membrane protein [Chitinivorax tropicus]
MELAYNYLIHVLSAFALLALFAGIYIKFTPFNELSLIRDGHLAPALSFGGALVGFSMTLASSIMHNPSWLAFLTWAATGMIVQLVAYVLTSRMLPHMNESLQQDNVGMGALMGSISLSVGLINAGCMS